MKDIKFSIIRHNDKDIKVITSLTISRLLQCRHHDILRKIDNIYGYPENYEKQVIAMLYKNAQGKTYRSYGITQDGFDNISIGCRYKSMNIEGEIYNAFRRTDKIPVPTNLGSGMRTVILPQKGVHQAVAKQQEVLVPIVQTVTMRKHPILQLISKFLNGLMKKAS